MASIELFHIQYRPSASTPPMRLLCQGVDVANEKLLWVDGLDVENPIVVPLSSVRALEWSGSFRELMTTNLDLAARVISEAQGEYSPTIMARMFVYMSQDPNLQPEDALDLAIMQSNDVIQADNRSRASFQRAAMSTPRAMARAALSAG